MKITLEKLQKWNASEGLISEFVSQTETDAEKLIIKLMKNDKVSWANWLLVRCLTKKNYIEYTRYEWKWTIPYTYEEKEKAQIIANRNARIKLINYGLTLLK